MAPMIRDPSIRREALFVLALTLIGAGLRGWAFGLIGLTHFDEGVARCVPGLWAVSPHGLWALDPMVIPYAPPGFPILVGLSFGLFGVGDTAAIFPALVCGIVTIPVVGWLGRRRRPPQGAAASALCRWRGACRLVAESATDAPFLLFWLLRWAWGRVPGTASIRSGVADGSGRRGCECSKYNGWIAGVIVDSDRDAWGRDPGARTAKVSALLRTFGYGLAGAVLAR